MAVDQERFAPHWEIRQPRDPYGLPKILGAWGCEVATSMVEVVDAQLRVVGIAAFYSVQVPVPQRYKLATALCASSCRSWQQQYQPADGPLLRRVRTVVDQLT